MSAKNLAEVPHEELIEFFNSVDTICTDCDGVLWLLSAAIEGSPQAFETFRKMGKRIFYITNNSTKTRAQFAEKCQNLGFQAKEDEIIGTAYLTAMYLKNVNFQHKVYLVGPKAVSDELATVGIKCSAYGPDPMIEEGFAHLGDTFVKDPEVKCVVVGFDEHFSYSKMLKAASYLSDPECLFLGTNRDESYPLKPGTVIPGAGSMVTAVAAGGGWKPFYVGKPSTFLGEVLKKEYNVDPKRTLMIGDRGNTDILLGTRCGFKTLLVLTGITHLQEVEEWKHSSEEEERGSVPDYYINRLGDVNDLLQKGTKVPCTCKRS